jgi:hypothetical protein
MSLTIRPPPSLSTFAARDLLRSRTEIEHRAARRCDMRHTVSANEQLEDRFTLGRRAVRPLPSRKPRAPNPSCTGFSLCRFQRAALRETSTLQLTACVAAGPRAELRTRWTSFRFEREYFRRISNRCRYGYRTLRRRGWPPSALMLQWMIRQMSPDMNQGLVTQSKCGVPTASQQQEPSSKTSGPQSCRPANSAATGRPRVGGRSHSTTAG